MKNQKSAEKLAKLCQFNSEDEYYHYIVHSLIVGQKSQSILLFKKMNNDSQQYFLIEYLDEKYEEYKDCFRILTAYIEIKNLLIKEVFYR